MKGFTLFRCGIPVAHAWSTMTLVEKREAMMRRGCLPGILTILPDDADPVRAFPEFKEYRKKEGLK